MHSLLELGASFGGLVITSGAILLAALVLRNPRSPSCLRTEFAAQATSLFLVAMLSFAVAAAIVTFSAAGLHLAWAAVAATGTNVVALVGLWQAFRIGERLALAESGRSPFEPLQRVGAKTQAEPMAH